MLQARFVPPSTCLLLLLPILGLWLPGFGEARHVHYLYALAMLGLLWLSRDEERAAISRPTLWGLLAAFFVLSLVTGFSRFYQFEINGYDFSIFDQMLSHTAKGRMMYSPIYDVNHLGVHASWLFFLIYPLHALFESPHYLLVLGAILHTLPAVPMFCWCKRHGHSDAEAVLYSVALVSCPALAAHINEGFRLESFVPLILVSYIYCVSFASRWVRCAVLALLLATKEDMALFVAGLSLYGVLWGKDRQDRAYHLFALAAAVGMFVFNTAFMQPLFMAGENLKTMSFWREFGDSPTEVVTSYITRPDKVLSAIFKSGWWNLYLPLLGLPLLHPAYLLMAAPGILILGTATAGAHLYQFGGYPVVPLVCISLAALASIKSTPLPLNRIISPSALKRLALVLAVLFPLWNAGWIQVVPWPSAEAQRVADFKARLERDFPQTAICTQGALFPHLGYSLKLLELTAACLTEKGSYVALAPHLDPFPHSAEQLAAKATKARREGRAIVTVGEFVLIAP